MQIRATKVFAKELTKQLKGNYCIESVELVKIPRDRAYITVGGGYSDIDIDWDDNTVKVLQVNYKPECYAMSQYVTTGEGEYAFEKILYRQRVSPVNKKYDYSL